MEHNLNIKETLLKNQKHRLKTTQRRTVSRDRKIWKGLTLPGPSTATWSLVGDRNSALDRDLLVCVEVQNMRGAGKHKALV